MKSWTGSNKYYNVKTDLCAAIDFWWINVYISSHLQRMYLVMELCDAGGIQKLLEKKTRFSEKVRILCVSFEHFLTIFRVSDGAVISLFFFISHSSLTLEWRLLRYILRSKSNHVKFEAVFVAKISLDLSPNFLLYSWQINMLNLLFSENFYDMY